MTSPNGNYEVVTHDYGEVRMGSPEFGRIEIRGASLDTSGEFGVAMAFSPDSRFLATGQLVGTVPGPHTRAVVFDFERRRRIVVHDQNPGFIKRLVWSSDGLLTITTWAHLAGEREHTWQAPLPRPTLPFMTAKPLNIQGRFRFAVVVVIALAVFALRETALYSTYGAQLLKHFWLASASVVCLVLIWPVIWRGLPWMRVVSVLMAIVPCLVLYWVCSDRLRF